MVRFSWNISQLIFKNLHFGVCGTAVSWNFRYLGVPSDGEKVVGVVFSSDEVHTRSLRLRVAVVTDVGVAVLTYLDFVVAVIIAVELEQDESKNRPQPQP